MQNTNTMMVIWIMLTNDHKLIAHFPSLIPCFYYKYVRISLINEGY